MTPLQTLLDAARPGDVVTPPPGEYIENAPVDVPPGVTLECDGVTMRRTESFAGQAGARTRYQLGLREGSKVVGVGAGLNIFGAAAPSLSTLTYVRELEAQHGINIVGKASDSSVTGNVTVSNVYGDGCYIGEGPVIGKTGRGDRPQRITIDGLTIIDAGRQGMAVAIGDDIVIRDVLINGAARSGIDLETNHATKTVNRVLIEDCDIRRFTNMTIAGAGAGPVNDVTIRRLACSELSAIWGGAEMFHRWLLDDVTAGWTSTAGDRALIRLGKITDVSILNLRLGQQTRTTPYKQEQGYDQQFAVRTYDGCERVNIEGIDWPTGWGALHPASTTGRTAHNAPFTGRPHWSPISPAFPASPDLVGAIEPIALPTLPVNA